MATSSWRLEDLQQLEELGLAGQLESTRLQEERGSSNEIHRTDQLHLPEPPDLYAMSDLCDLLMTEDISNPSLNIQPMIMETLLIAPTAHVVKHDSQTITYINRGQWYEIHLKPCVQNVLKNGTFHRCVLSVGFSELRMRNNEYELFKRWGQDHPCERILDIDRRGCDGVSHVKESEDLNTLSLLWQPIKPAIVSVKINCLSSEFAAKKHGGEKGILLQISMTVFNGDVSLQTSQCNIKVFKDKGGDRKQKQDQQKIEKLSHNERCQYKSSNDVTIFSVLPSSQHSSSIPNSSPENLISQSTVTGSALHSELNVMSSIEECHQWLSIHHFSPYLSLFARYSGCDLLRLSRKDLMELCGTADGIRLFNALRSRTLKTVYVCMEEDQTVYQALCLEQLTAHELLCKLSDKVGLKICQVSGIVQLTNSGIPVMVDDTVVRNLCDEVNFIVSAVKDETSGTFRLLLRSPTHDNSSLLASPSLDQSS